MSHAATVYFIDDSATMREVIKIAFRRENLNVVACPSADAAIAQMEQTPPDVVITDVIMPEKDGYEVCQYIKRHPVLGRTPVVLMSGVVNRAVAEKAFAVKADELIRKPFQPQDLITRVRHLLTPKAAPAPPIAAAAHATAALSSIFQAPPAAPAMQRVAAAAPVPASAPPAPPVAPQLAPRVAPRVEAPAVEAPPRSMPAPPQRPAAPAAIPADVAKLRVEVLRLEGLVRKLQSELEAEREYSRALEEHVKTLQEAE